MCLCLCVYCHVRMLCVCCHGIAVGSAEYQHDVHVYVYAYAYVLYAVGSADFYPATSGKCSAARYLMSRYASEAQHCAFLCDDDNDMVRLMHTHTHTHTHTHRHTREVCTKESTSTGPHNRGIGG